MCVTNFNGLKTKAAKQMLFVVNKVLYMRKLFLEKNTDLGIYYANIISRIMVDFISDAFFHLPSDQSAVSACLPRLIIWI